MTDKTQIAHGEIGHNSGDFYAQVKQNPALIFDEPSMLQGLLDELKETYLDESLDPSETKQNAAIRSNAAKVGKVKAAIEKAGLAKGKAYRDAAAALVEQRKMFGEPLQELQDLIGKPAAEWKAKEDARLAKISETMDLVESLSAVAFGDTSSRISERIESLRAIVIDDEIFMDQAVIAHEEITDAVAKLEELFEAAKAQEEQARLAKEQLDAANERARIAEEEKGAADRRNAELQAKIDEATSLTNPAPKVTTHVKPFIVPPPAPITSNNHQEEAITAMHEFILECVDDFDRGDTLLLLDHIQGGHVPHVQYTGDTE